MITLYHAPMSRSVRVRWLLEELAIPYRLEARKLRDLKTPDYLAVHPLGKVPAIVDGGLVLLESGAIVQYLLETYGAGRLEPKLGSPERPAFLQWMWFAEGTLTPPLGEIAQHSLIRAEADRIPAVLADAAKRAGNVLAVLERALAGRSWLLAEFSAADVMMGYSVALASLLRMLGDETPNVKAYLARCQERPAFRVATGA